MDRERDRDVAEELIEDARKQTGGGEPKERPGQPGGDESADKPKD